MNKKDKTVVYDAAAELNIIEEPLDFDSHLTDISTTAEEKDPINPNHYKQARREAIDIMEDIVSDPAFNGVEGFLVAIAVKYLLRHKHKNGVEDLNKAIWYIKRLIAYNERK